MEKYNITGMSCAACSARVEKAVKGVKGVSECWVNLLTNSMTVEGDYLKEDVVNAVIDAGYGVYEENNKKDTFKDEETGKLLKRLIISAVFLIILMYVSMGHTMFDFPLPDILSKNPLSLALIEMLLSVIVLVINQKFFINGFKGLIKKSPNMDTLVALGSGASFVYSVFVVFQMSNLYLNGETGKAFHLIHNLYFESAAMILVLITLGKMLEAYSKGKTTNAIKSLMELKPQTARVEKEGREISISAEEIKVGDILVVRPGERFSTDGVVTEGFSAVDQSSLTGESVPVDKKEGDDVFASTVNKTGFLKLKATKTVQENTLAQVIKMVSDASATKAPIAKIADKVSGMFVPAVILVATITFIVWMVLDASFQEALTRGISVLVISCPCALGLATPVAIMVGSGVGAKNGILFKNATSLENTGRTKIVALDKTGTITKGEMSVTDMFPSEVRKDDLLKVAYALEIKSQHPIANAIVNKCKELNIEETKLEEFKEIPGKGLCAKVHGEEIFGGNFEYISTVCQIPKSAEKAKDDFSKEGKTPLFFAKKGVFLGTIFVQDTLREDSILAIEELKKMGIKVVILTGDNELVAKTVADKVKVDKVFSSLLPEGKEKVIKELKKEGKVLMAGDGINDAVALTSADIGVAIGKGTDIAKNSSDIVLMKDSITDIALAVKLSRKVLKNIKENLFWAFIYNIISIPVAAGVLSNYGIEMTPMLGALAMSLSSVCVVSNALRLNFFGKKENNKVKEIKKMEKVIKIEGMMCPHCEGRVKQTLEAIEGVLEATPSHKDNNAKIILAQDVPFETLKKAVEEQGYKVTE